MSARNEFLPPADTDVMTERERRRLEAQAEAITAAEQRASQDGRRQLGRNAINQFLRDVPRENQEKKWEQEKWRRVFRRKETLDEAEARADEERTAALTEALDRRDATGSFGNRAPATTLDGGQRGTPAPPDANTAVNDWIRARGQDDL